MLKKYSSPNFGALVDFGNNISMYDPVDVINKLAPYVKSCHMKNMALQNYADGFLMSEVLFEDVSWTFRLCGRSWKNPIPSCCPCTS
ncbi:MAG: hypothetical protein U1E93_04740 [Alphaproteobacteria bacterium]